MVEVVGWREERRHDTLLAGEGVVRSDLELQATNAGSQWELAAQVLGGVAGCLLYPDQGPY